MKKINIHAFYRLFNSNFRVRRMEKFEKEFSLTDSTTIIDVGGSQFNWELIKTCPKITLINLHYPEDGLKKEYKSNILFEVGDGTNLSYNDKSFDIAYSNSVIEHLFTHENQMKFANEILRTGKKVYVQTPAQEFFIEPHLITPFIHWLPLEWQRKLMRHFTVWGLITKPSQTTINNFLLERKMLNYSEFKNLFPTCEIQKEKFLGFTKSYIAILR